MTGESQIRRTRRQCLRAGGVAIAATLPVTSTATASGSGALPQGVLADGIENGGDRLAFASGLASRYSGGYGAPPEAATLADRMRNEFNANSEAWVAYGNWLLEETDTDALGSATIAVDVAITRGRWPTRDESVPTTIDVHYDDDGDEFTGLEWMLDEAEDPTYRVEVRNEAAENAADELQEFRREFIGGEDNEHELPDAEYLSELAGRYSDSLRFGDDSKHVLELLLGESGGAW